MKVASIVFAQKGCLAQHVKALIHALETLVCIMVLVSLLMDPASAVSAHQATTAHGVKTLTHVCPILVTTWAHAGTLESMNLYVTVRMVSKGNYVSRRYHVMVTIGSV